MSDRKTLVHEDFIGKIGLFPAGPMILVLPDLVDDMEDTGDTYKKKGGMIEIPKEIAKQMNRVTQSQESGTVVAIGMISYADYCEGEHWCRLGDRVYYTRHAGKWMLDPKSGKKFLAMTDNDVTAVISDVPPGWTADEYAATQKKV